MMERKILEDIEQYYSSKIKTFGLTPKGVDWNSEDSQNLRFRQLMNVINVNERFSILDYGCGYGALLPVLQKRHPDVDYTGYDISLEMIDSARKLYGEGNSKWIMQLGSEKFDFTVASGIFNVKLSHKADQWQNYIYQTLDVMNEKTIQGFSFNMLTSYSDKSHMRNDLYYADPEQMLNYCKLNYSKYVAILHDYPLYEFTVIIRKNV